MGGKEKGDGWEGARGRGKKGEVRKKEREGEGRGSEGKREGWREKEEQRE